MYPENLRYSKDHEWIEAKTGTNLKVGVSAYAIEQLGDIVHMDLPKVGDVFKAGDTFGTIESTKTVSDLYMPASGKVTAINSELLKSPESLQSDATQWLVEIAVSAPQELETLMDSKAYSKLIGI